MTKVVFSNERNTYSVRAIGHADGFPLVCAAVSTLMFSLAGWIRNTKSVKIEKERLDEGDAEIVFTGLEYAKTVYDFMLIAFLQLEKTEQNAVAVSFRCEI